MKKNTLDRWMPVRELINFQVFIHVGGGLGDIAHRYKDNAYLRILKGLKTFFPNLYVYLYLHGKNPGLTWQIFETDPSIDRIIVSVQQPGEFDWTHIEQFLLETCKVNKSQMAQYIPEFDAETVFRRAINRIYPLIKFPRIRAISMDDFFQQMSLDINDFEWELAEVKIIKKDQEIAQKMLNGAQVEGSSIIGIHPFTQDKTRCCYPVSKWKELIRRFLDKNYAVAIFGASGEGIEYEDILELSHVIDLTHEIGLRSKIAILKQCSGCITVDGAIMHLAWLHAIPTVSIIETEDNNLIKNVHGYHWAAAAKEPFAHRMIVPYGTASAILVDEIIEKAIMLRDTKGIRVSKIWKDQ
jgi:ADP-heptose:LPS heptosyltransferase